MNSPISASSLDALFRNARSQNKWKSTAIDDKDLIALYDLLKWGPTSANSSPGRFVFCRTAEAKERLASCAMERNRPKITGAPVCAIIAYDTKYFESLPRLFPVPTVFQMAEMHRNNPYLAESTAFRNGTLQGAYLIIAARSIGLDCGPMSGFDNQKVDAEFFAETPFKSNFICSLGHGDPSAQFPRHPRRSFDEVCSLI